jgi:hypothetical protein
MNAQDTLSPKLIATEAFTDATAAVGGDLQAMGFPIFPAALQRGRFRNMAAKVSAAKG